MGHRTWNLADGRIWLESEDLEKMDLRLKEFADVALHDRTAQIESMERSDKRPIVHWLPDRNATEAVLTGTKDNGVFHIEGRLKSTTIPSEPSCSWKGSAMPKSWTTPRLCSAMRNFTTTEQSKNQNLRRRW